MRKLLLLIALALPWPAFGQGVLWQAVIWDSLPTGRPLFPRAVHGKILSGIAHPNGGLLGLGLSYFGLRRPTTSTDTYYGVVSVRISASGDSLGLHRLPGYAGSYPVFVRNCPYASEIWALISRDTVVDGPPAVLREPFFARLDTNGLIADSFSVSIINPDPMGIADASFVTRKKVLITGLGNRIINGSQVEVFEAAMIAWPQGVVLWRRYFRPNVDFNRLSCVRQTDPNKIYLIGAIGNCLGAQRIDTLGNQTGGFCLYTDTLNGAVGGDAMPLPDGRWAVRLNYGGPIASNPTRPYSTVLAVVDTAGHIFWRLKEDFPVNRGVYGFMQLIGVNEDGSMLVQYQNPNDCIIRRYSINGVLETSWQTYDSLSDTVGVSTGPAVYLGTDKAYIIGSGRVQRPDPNHQRTRYWAAYLDGTGNPFDPTETRGPRVRQIHLAATVYPNPATERIYVSSDKPLTYRILSPTGALVLEGAISRNQPAELAVLVPGIYQLLLSDGTQTVRRRFVKQ